VEWFAGSWPQPKVQAAAGRKVFRVARLLTITRPAQATTANPMVDQTRRPDPALAAMAVPMALAANRKSPQASRT
jgi:hypothetical protein